jgi:pyruvate kinase
MHPRRTKLHATLGPASEREAVLRGLIEAGVDGCRINFSHANAESAGRLVGLVRQLSHEAGRPVAIRQDLQGPRIRVGQLASEPRRLVNGERLVLRPGLTAPDEAIPIDCPELFGAVEAGRLILLDEGQLELRVLQTEPAALVCEVVHGGSLLSRKGLNLPGVHLPLPALSAKDRDDLQVGIRLGVDFVSLSFVQSGEDLRQARAFLRAHGGEAVRLVAKIEKLEAVERFEQILDEVDGISIARGDLGLEVGIENLPHVQANLIAASRRRGLLVQVGGEVLHTMIQAPRPTRSEVADVALLVAHGVDGISLSGETAIGHDPVEAMRILDRIVRRAEQEERAQGRLVDAPHRAQTPVEALDYAHRRAAFPIQVAANGHEANWLSCHWGIVVETG